MEDYEIGLGCADKGGSYGIGQTAKRLMQRGRKVKVFCNKEAGEEALREIEVPFIPCRSAEDVLRHGSPRVWGTSMDSTGGIGFLVARHLRQRRDWNGKIIAMTDYPTSAALLGEEWPYRLPDIITSCDAANTRIIRQAWRPFDVSGRVQIVETGCPAFDRLEGMDVKAIRRQKRRLLGVPEDAFFVLLATNDEGTADLFEEFIPALPPRAFYTVRPHPRIEERAPNDYLRLKDMLLSYPSGQVRTMGVMTTIETICTVDAVVAPCSTALAEATKLGVIGINLFTSAVAAWYVESIGHIAKRFPWSAGGAVAEARTTGGLGRLLRQARSGRLEERLQPNREACFPKNAGASQRAADLYESCL